jgi:hypothetical protein
MIATNLTKPLLGVLVFLLPMVNLLAQNTKGKRDNVANPTEINTTFTTSNSIDLLPAFLAIKSYQLTKIEAVSAKGIIASTNELLIETENVKKDFPEMITQLGFAENSLVRLFVPEKSDVRAIETRNLNNVEWLIENKKCETCTKTLYLTIENETTESIIYILDGEDENSRFAYRLVFNAIEIR